MKRSQLTGRAEYAQAVRERVAAEREAAAALAELTATRARLTERPLPIPASSTVRNAERRKLTNREKRFDAAQRALEEIDRRVADARARTVAGESGFEHLSAAHPLLLLPVRLETRFAWITGNRFSFTENSALEQVLLVRIYPDEIHEDSHEPEITPAEKLWMREFRARMLRAADLKPIREAWAELIRRAGPTRAAWLGHCALSVTQPGTRQATFTRPSVARLLPDRWAAYATLPDGSTLTSLSAPVREPLETGPSPDGMDWMVNFDAAMKTGMALVIRAIPPEVTEIRRLIVVGARGTLDPLQVQTELEKLLDAHHFTRGLGLIAPGSPTNSGPGGRAEYSTRPLLPAILDIEERRFLVGGRSEPLCQRGDNTDGTALATALGIDPAVFAFVAHADATDELDARLLRSLLVSATQRTLTRLLTGILEENTLIEMLEFVSDQVSALGPLPTLRIGNQPYSVLPVMLADAAQFPSGSRAARYLPVLDRLRSVWQSAAATIDWVGKSGSDPGEILVRLLQRDGVASRFAFRPMLGPQIGAVVAAGLTGQSAVVLSERRQRAADVLDMIWARNSANSQLLQTMVLPTAPALTDPIVQPDDAPDQSVQRAEEYLEIVAALRPDRLLQHDYDGGERPRSLFFAIARLAMLELADARTRQVLTNAGADPAHWDDEEVPSPYRDPLATMLARLQAQDPADPLATIAFHLSELGGNAGVLSQMRETLRYFKRRSPSAVELQLRASIGLFSNRLDAWYTGLAYEQLVELRNGVNTAAGVNIGAYGVLERIVRAPRQAIANSPGLFSMPTNGGYVHAPSVNHGAAAAVLRSVYLAHSAAVRGEAFSVDLSSQRVRHALSLLEGIRAGQPLAALLGYRIERELAEEQLQRFIAPFRAVAPLLANRLTPSGAPAEAVAANNVVDGLTLLELAGYDGGASSASVTVLWAANPSLGALTAAESAAVTRVLASAQDAVDAVSDLVLAESVYQAVQGNPSRTGAAVDSVSGAPVPPVEPGIARTPRSGVAATHRVLAVMEAAAAAPVSGWATTPRAASEPRLEAWCASFMPRTAQIHLRARFRGSDGEVTATLDDVRLSDLFDSAVDAGLPYLPFAALDLVALADPRETPQRSALEARLSALLELQRPLDLPDAALELVYDRPAAWDAAAFGIVETLEIAAQLRNVIGCGRPLAPEDFILPGEAPTLQVDAAEYADRAQNAVVELNDVTALLTAAAANDDAGSMREALFSADALGVAGAAPPSVRDATDARERTRLEKQARLIEQLRAQAKAVLAELARRSRRVADAGTDPVARLKAVFGDAFVSLPVMTDVSGGGLRLGATAAGASGSAVRAWVARAARVREGVRLLDSAIGAAEAVAQSQAAGTAPRLDMRQLGGTTGERWIALPLAAGTTSLPGGRISLLTVATGTLPTTAIAGLFIDEWIEVVPSAEETTSVAFHYEAPSSAPPQVLLLGVPAPGNKRWTEAMAQGFVVEALDLARIRLVDMDDLSDLGQLLPAFITTENTAGDVASLDVETLTRTGGN